MWVYIYDTILQYYGHREKLKTIGREGDLEKLNRTALKLAKKVAVKHDKITAAAICNTTLYLPGDEVANATVRENFKVCINTSHRTNMITIIILLSLSNVSKLKSTNPFFSSNCIWCNMSREL